MYTCNTLLFLFGHFKYNLENLHLHTSKPIKGLKIVDFFFISWVSPRQIFTPTSSSSGLETWKAIPNYQAARQIFTAPFLPTLRRTAADDVQVLFPAECQIRYVAYKSRRLIQRHERSYLAEHWQIPFLYMWY